MNAKDDQSLPTFLIVENGGAIIDFMLFIFI